MTKLPEGRKPITDQEAFNLLNKNIRELTDDERRRAIEREISNMNRDESDAISLVAEMQRQNLTLTEALEAIKNYANDKEFNNNLDKLYGNEVFDDWDYWHEGDID
jgi:hypothetical protein